MGITGDELYCVAKVLQSVLFSADHSLFYGCQFCKIREKCMPDNKVHSNMFFDKARVSLQKVTEVDLDLWEKENKFFDQVTKFAERSQ